MVLTKREPASREAIDEPRTCTGGQTVRRDDHHSRNGPEDSYDLDCGRRVGRIARDGRLGRVIGVVAHAGLRMRAWRLHRRRRMLRLLPGRILVSGIGSVDATLGS